MRLSQPLCAILFSVGAIGMAGCSCQYQVSTAQPIQFGESGGTGSFTVTTRSGCKWNADEDSQAEDWVKVAGGTVTGTGSMNFTVLSAAQQPNVPLPRSGYIQVYEDGNNGGPATKVQIAQK